MGWDYSQLNADDQTNHIVHEELWWDVCEIVNDLAQLLLEKREERAELLNELKNEFKNTIKNL